MKTFIDRIIEYLDSGFDKISALSKKPKGHYAYEQGLLPSTTPYYVVQLLDNYTSKEDFQEEVEVTMPIQVNVYGVKMNIDGITTNAQQVAIILGDMCVKLLEEFKYTQNDITTMRRTSSTPALPFEDGSKAYYTAIRYKITKQK